MLEVFRLSCTGVILSAAPPATSQRNPALGQSPHDLLPVVTPSAELLDERLLQPHGNGRRRLPPAVESGEPVWP